MKQGETKLEYVIRAKAALHEHLRAKSWPEKVRSIERMNRATRSARRAMREAMEKQADQ